MRYTKLSITLNSTDKPPYFMGSQLRGAFGYALKKVVCVNPSFDCNGCFATQRCSFYEIYEDKNIFRKYRFDFDLSQKIYKFNFYLFETACEELPYVISAFYKLFNNIGLGVERKIYNKLDLYINNSKYIDELPSNYIKEFISNSYSPHIIIKFITPLRIKSKNRYLKTTPSLESIILSILNRSSSLKGDNSYQKFTHKIKYTQISSSLKYKSIQRYSSRQKAKINLDGLVGYIEYKDLDKISYDILKLGELIGVGKQVVFGNGKIEVLEIIETKENKCKV